jgi:hypothetical protein
MADEEKIEPIGEIDEEDLLHQISQAEERYAELKRQTGDAYAALGISPEEAADVLGKATVKEYKDLSRRAQELEKELFDGSIRKRAKSIRRQVLAKRKRKKRKRSSRRMLGARKGWLDTR